MGTFVRNHKNNFELALERLTEEVLTESKSYAKMIDKDKELVVSTGSGASFAKKANKAGVDGETAKDLTGIATLNGEVRWVTEDKDPKGEAARWNPYNTAKTTEKNLSK